MMKLLTSILVLLACFALVPVALANNVTPSAWDEPTLAHPTEIPISNANGTPGRNLRLDSTKDYVLTCATNPMPATYALVVYGGHNVVYEHCNYQVSKYDCTVNGQPARCLSGGAQFKNQTGTLWVHDVQFSNDPVDPGLGEGIDLQEPGTTTVVMRDVLIGSASQPLKGSFGTNHADCAQLWSGPQRFLVDALTCYSQYQGFFLLPNQHDTTTNETTWDFRHVNLHLNPGSYSFTFGTNGPQHVDMNVEHTYVDGPGQPLLYMKYQGGEGFGDVLSGTPPNGDYVYPTSTGASGADDFPVDPMPFVNEQ